MGKIVFSQRLDFLAEAFAEEISQTKTFPLQKRLILVPKGMVKSWLLLELAKRGKEKAILGCKISTVEEWLGSDSCFQLTCAIYLELLKTSDEDLFHYLGEKGSKWIELSQHLASLFQQYGQYAPEFFRREEKNWQKKLLQTVFAKEAPVQALPTLSPLQFPISCFGIDFLPECIWNYLSQCPSFSAYLFSPCMYFWEDTHSDWEQRKISQYWKRKGVSSSHLAEYDAYLKEAPSLLANWGKVGRETLKQLDHFDFPMEERYAPLQPDSLLKRVQNFLLQFEKPQTEIVPDRSLCIFRTGSSRFREVEVLCEEILSLASEEEIPFSEIAVLVSDLPSYAPLIELLFSNHHIPYRIAEVPIDSKSLFLQGLFRLLDLLSGEWNAEALVSLFESPSFYRRFEWSEKIREWISIAFEDGIEALLDALFTLSPEQSLRIEMGDIEPLGAFISLFQALSEFRIEKKEKMFAEWASFLEAISEKFLVCDLGEEADASAWGFFQAFLKELKEIQNKLGEKAVPFELIHCLLRQPIYGQVHANHLHAVRIAPFSEGCILSQKALFLVGMDEESFPKDKLPSSLNLLKGEPIYVPKPAERDRYLFLRALFSASEFLRISYGHISKEEGKPIGPSPVVEELIHFLGPSFATKGISTRMNCTKTVPKAAIPFNTVPSRAIPEEEIVVSLSDLSLLARNPWKFYLRKRLGIHLEDRREDSLRLQKATLLRSCLTKPVEQLLKKKIAPGLIGEAISLEVLEKASLWKGQLPGPLFSASLLQSCREKRWVDPTRVELPCLELSLTEKTRVRITGEIPHLSKEALIYPGESTLRGLLPIWPVWLCTALVLEIPHILCLKSAKTKTVENPEEKLKAFLRYFFAAESALSPLLPDWADVLFRKGANELEKKMEATFSGKGVVFEDPVLKWILSRSNLPSAQEIESHWGEFLRETFAGFIQLFEKGRYAKV